MRHDEERPRTSGFVRGDVPGTGRRCSGMREYVHAAVPDEAAPRRPTSSSPPRGGAACSGRCSGSSVQWRTARIPMTSRTEMFLLEVAAS